MQSQFSSNNIQPKMAIWGEFSVWVYLFGGFFTVLYGYPTLFMRRPFSMIDAGEEKRCEVGE